MGSGHGATHRLPEQHLRVAGTLPHQERPPAHEAAHDRAALHAPAMIVSGWATPVIGPAECVGEAGHAAGETSGPGWVRMVRRASARWERASWAGG